MIILEAHLKGYRNFKDEVNMTFDKGYNLFLGDNGQGKSSVNMYIDLNLLNELGTDLTFLDHINDESDKFESYLIFENLGKTYKSYLDVKIVGSKTESSRRIEDSSGNLIAEGTTQCMSILNEMFDPIITKYALALRQGDLEIITCKAAERFKIFQKVLDVRFKEGIEATDKSISDLKTLITTLDGKITVYTEKDYTPTPEIPRLFSDAEVKSLKKEREGLASKLILQESLVELHKSLSADCLAVEDRISDTESSLRRKTRVKKSTEEQIYTEEQILNHESIISLEKSSEDVVTSRDLLDQDKYITEALLSFNKTISDLEDKVTTAEDTLAGMPRKRALSDKLEDILSKKEKARDNASKREYRVRELTDKISFQSKGKCEACGNEIDDSDVPRLKNNLEVAKKDVIEAKESIKTISDEYTTHKTALEDYKKFQDDRKDAQTALDLIKGKLESALEKEELIIEAAKEDYLKDITSKNTEINTIAQGVKSKIASLKATSDEKTSQLISLEEDITKLDEDIILAESELSTKKAELAKVDLPDTTSLTEGISDIDLDLSDSDKNIKAIEAVDTANKLLITQEESDIEELTSLRTKRDTKNADLTLRTEAKKVLTKMLPQFIISETVQGITDSMNTFIENIYDRNLNVILKDTATSLKMLSRGKSVATLSGAEKVITCLAFLDSLREFAHIDNGTVILDETDAFVDGINSLALFEAIENLPYEQILLVTHSPSMKEYFINKGAKAFTFANGTVVEGA